MITSDLHPQLGIFAKGHFGKLFRVINQHINKLGIPVGIIKSAALAMNLMREPAGRDNRHIDIFRKLSIARRSAAEFVTTARAWYRNCSTPICNGITAVGHPALHPGNSAESGEKRPWSSFLSIKNDISNSSAIRLAPMCLESAALPDRRQAARSAALIGNVILTIDSQRKVE